MRRFSTTSGITLIELMVVMAIISIVLGISSAFFTQFNKRLAVQGAAFEVRNMLRASKNYAAESQNKSVINIQKNTVTLEGSRLVGCWHLEKITQNSSEGFGGIVEVEGGKSIAGRVGKAIALSRSGQVRCGTIQNLGLHNPFIISFWSFFYTGQTGNRVVFSLGKNGNLQLTPQHTLVFNWQGEIINITSSLPLFEWTHIKIRYDGRKVTIFINNIEEKVHFFDNFLPIEDDQAQLIFAEESQFNIDEIVIESLVELERYTLPENLSFGVHTTPIIFDETGKLDPLFHQGRANVVIEEQATKKEFAVIVSLMGQLKIEESVERQ